MPEVESYQLSMQLHGDIETATIIGRLSSRICVRRLSGSRAATGEMATVKTNPYHRSIGPCFLFTIQVFYKMLYDICMPFYGQKARIRSFNKPVYGNDILACCISF